MSERNKRFSRIIESENTIDQSKEEHASIIEEFIAKYLAPEVLSNQGRALILVTWVLMTVFSLNGAN